MDRRRQRSITNWSKQHKSYVDKFKRRVAEATQNQGQTQQLPYSAEAFSNYLAGFLAEARVDLLKPAYRDEILEEPILFDNHAQQEYNKLVREGEHVDFAPVMNFVVNCAFVFYILETII